MPGNTQNWTKRDLQILELTGGIRCLFLGPLESDENSEDYNLSYTLSDTDVTPQ